jgi:TolA-binding protein
LRAQHRRLGTTHDVHDVHDAHDAHDANDANDANVESSPRNARAWFAQASVARRAGWMQEAADAYAELLRRYPRDARAGLSAFELGRIRMDALGDSRGAIEAFSEALRLSRKSQFREDALARLAIAHDTLGENVDCQAVRGRYVAEFPAGVHLGTLASLCGKALP